MRSDAEILEEIEHLRDAALLAQGHGLSSETAMVEALRWALGIEDRSPTVLLAHLQQAFPGHGHARKNRRDKG